MSTIRLAAVPGYPLIGSLLTFLIKSSWLRAPHEAFMHFCRLFPNAPLLSISFGLIPRPNLIVIQDPNLARRVLLRSDLFPKGQTYRATFREVTPTHLPGLDDGPHAHRRRSLAVALLHKVLCGTDLNAILDLQAEALLNDLQASSMQRPLEVYSALKAYTFNTITSVVLGEPILDPHIRSAFQSIMEEWQHRATELFAAQHWSWWPRQHRLQDARQAVNSFLRSKVAEARRGTAPPQPSCILYHALAQDDDDIEAILIDVCFTLIAMGHDNVASSLTWTLVQLATAPISLTPHEQEVDHIVRESLRLYPPTPLLSRRAASREVLWTQLGIQDDPQRLEFIISPYILHHSQAIWGPDSEEYRPARWASLQASHHRDANTPPVTHPNHRLLAYLPFGAGSRACIGQQLAYATMRAVLHGLVCRDLRIHLASHCPATSVKPVLNVFLKPDRPVHVFCTRRSDATCQPSASASQQTKSFVD